MVEVTMNSTSIVEILTYQGNNLDILLNYIALTLTTIATIEIFSSLQLKIKNWRKLLWLPVLIGLAIFQVN